MQFLTQGSLSQTNGIVDRTGGYFVWNLSCDRLLSAVLYNSAEFVRSEGLPSKLVSKQVF